MSSATQGPALYNHHTGAFSSQTIYDTSEIAIFQPPKPSHRLCRCTLDRQASYAAVRASQACRNMFQAALKSHFCRSFSHLICPMRWEGW
jgi:hypothetical protein